ncbi:MAG: hypothetical protein ACYDAN_05165 [Candidatus Limnocylindrales bacterium]
MALHTPVHQLGVTPHPHVLRNTLVVVVIAALALATLAVLVVVRPLSTSTASVSADQLVTPQMIEFRASEREFAYPWQYTGPH